MTTRHPHPKATLIFARSVYRELGRAGYVRADLVRFVNDLMELITSPRSEEPPASSRVLGFVDPETSIPSEVVVRDILDYETRRASETGRLLVVIVEVAFRDWEVGDTASSVHAHVADVLIHCTRRSDTVGRLDANRYVLVLPGAREGILQNIFARMARPLTARARAEDGRDTVPLERIELRWVAWTPQLTDANAMLSACEAAPRTRLVDLVETETRTAVPRTSGDVVLALGGGAARAVAHVGVLRALRRAGITVGGFAGTSAGALVAAMSLVGLDEDEMLERFLAFPRSALYAQIRREYVSYAREAGRIRVKDENLRRSRVAFLSANRLSAVSDDLYQRFIEYFIGDDRPIDSLPAPFAASVTDLADGRSATLAHGSLAAALRASCALPGLFPPQHDHGRVFVDGAVLSEVPVAAARRIRANGAIVAVHLLTPKKRWQRFHNSEQVLARASSIAHTELVKEQLRDIPAVIGVPVEDVGWLDFRRATAIAQLGDDAATAALDTVFAEIENARSKATTQ